HEQLSNYDFNRITKIYTPLDYTIGWFLFYMPTYTVHNFGFTPMSATESNANSVGFDLIVQGESTEEVSPEFGPVPFCLEDPSKNIDPKNKFQKALTKGWGTSAENKLSTFEINDWNNISPFFSNGTEKLFDMTGMKFGEATLKSCITTTSGTTKTTSGKLTIKISLNSEFIKDIFSVSSSLSISTSVTTEYSTAVSYSMKVEWGLKNSGPEYSTWYCDPHLLVYQEGGQNNLPEMLKYQTPWLLTWVAGAD
ncbi:MAG: hypothetical protein NXI19_21680, partial [Alphaproteobacteria bacterium]|nr:hypothetical protein [Alphaproteobacteria bacterium]